MATYHVDPELGSDSTGNGTSGNPYRSTTPLNAATLAPGDLIKIKKSPDPTLVGSATFVNNTNTITLGTAVTLSINECQTAWTASANVTTSTSAWTYPVTTAGNVITVAAGFTTGKIAYAPTANTDYSAYEQISFYFRNTVATTNVIRIDLCSDATGDVPVNSFLLPYVYYSTGYGPITLNYGAPLGNNIQSIALYAVSDPGTPSFFIDNIIACKAKSAADSLTLNSLVSKNNGTDAWYPIFQILGTSILISSYNVSSTLDKYIDTSETTNLYKRDSFQMTGWTTANINVINDSGTDTSPITIEGGYATDWSAVTGITIYDGMTNTGANGFTPISIGSTISNTIIKNISSIRTPYTVNCAGNNNSFDNVGGYRVSSAGLNFAATSNYITINNCDFNCTANGVYFLGSKNYVINGRIYNCVDGILGGIFTYARNITMKYNQYGIYAAANMLSGSYFEDCVFANNTGSSIILTNTATGRFYLKNCLLSDSTEVSGNFQLGTYIFSEDHDQTPGFNRIWSYLCTAESETSVVHTVGGKSLKFIVNNTGRVENTPFVVNLAKIAVTSGVPVTLSIWAYKSNIYALGKLIVRKNSDIGVSSDQVVTITPSASTTWEQSSNIVISPTANGVIEVDVESYCPGTNVGLFYVDDLQVSW